jgi:hypothetical protein
VTEFSNEEPERFIRYAALDKSDVMTSFGMIDWSDVCRVFRQAGSSFLSQNNPLVLVGFYQNLYRHASNAKVHEGTRKLIIGAMKI